MIRFFKAVLLAVFGGVLAAYGVSNRHYVDFVTDPLVPMGEKAPVYSLPAVRAYVRRSADGRSDRRNGGLAGPGQVAPGRQATGQGSSRVAAGKWTGSASSCGPSKSQD